MKKLVYRGYALICYALGLISVGFYADFFVGAYTGYTVFGSMKSPLASSLLVDAFLLFLFAVQHSIMARPWVKERMRKVIPQPIERSTYILCSALLTFALVFLWQPVPWAIFDLRGTEWEGILWGFYALGWFFTLFSTFLIDHFDLFGLKQAWVFKGAKTHVYKLVRPLFYRIIRHPIYLGWFIVHWATPHMTAGQLLMAVFFTAYIYRAIHWEERDLVATFGTRYQAYKKHTGKILPGFRVLRYHFKTRRRA